ncbi:hypothetical protein Q1695_002172 [Nippostrongylus brasiliensis]|nr:hypothetical protein Q1695_002172 [Nippostrongylus brasiliensis]
MDNSKRSPELRQFHYRNIIVHFDLKGAPPRINYFIDLLHFVAQIGATGILIEWEDMFPWSGKLEMVRSTNAYTVAEVKRILQTAKNLNLDVIPLVQTFGHMEWLLKYERFRKFRENDKFPQVICVGNKEAVDLVKEAIKQVVDVHLPFGLKRFHIGADEAFQFGVCEESQKVMQDLLEEQPLIMYPQYDSLAFWHIARIANYTHRVTKGARILAWHDMINRITITKFTDSTTGEILEPVIWDYSETLQGVAGVDIKSYRVGFKNIWASSAFKGANTPNAMYSNIVHYAKNNAEWLDQLRQLYKTPMAPNVEGIIITGWSRYDHMAGLCEILPIGIPSMVVNTQIALMGSKRRFDATGKELIIQQAYEAAGSLMKCSIYGEPYNTCQFPGHEVFDLWKVFLDGAVKALDGILSGNAGRGWISEYNIAHNFSQNWYLENDVQNVLFNVIQGVPTQLQQLETNLLRLFHKGTVDEFFFSNVDPILTKIRYLVESSSRLSQKRTYGRRPFKIKRLKFGNFTQELLSLVNPPTS